MIPLLVIVGADKGGVGKTTVTRALLDYLTAHQVDFRAFDTETPKGVLNRFYPNKAPIVDLTTSDGHMAVFDDMPPVTVVDIKAGLLSPTLKVMGEIGILDMIKSGSLQIMVLHIIGSTLASINEIKDTADIMAGAQHILVKNRTNAADFFESINSVAKDAFQNSLVLDVPKLDERATEYLEATSMPFSAFLADPKQSFVMKGYIRNWLAVVYKQFDQAFPTLAAANVTATVLPPVPGANTDVVAKY